MIERLVLQMEAGGCTEIRVVTRPEKHDVRRYAEQRGLTVVLGHPAHIGESLAAGLAGADGDGLVALGFPDSLWEPLDGFARLRQELDARSDAVLGLFDSPDATRSDVVVLGGDGRVQDILVKPAKPPSNLIWGCLVARARALRGIERSVWPSDHLRPLVEAGRVGARYLSDCYLDIGTPEALARARHEDRAQTDDA